VNATLQLDRQFPDSQRRTDPTEILRATGLAVVLLALTLGATAQTTNPPPATNQVARTNQSPATNPPAATAPAPAEPVASRSGVTAQGVNESAFALIAERNIFNANRSGGRVQLSSSRRAARVETFTLVGTMAYEKGVFAFFEGSSSEFSKVLKTNGVIAGHKLAEIYADSVKLEADGKQFELPIGSQMRREDAGTWKMAEAPAGNGGSDAASPMARVGSSSASSPSSSAPANQSEILKRLMERREKE
jgi:hypothetical protein